MTTETTQKTALPTQEQDANFEFLIGILESAKTFKEAKSVFFHKRKIEGENKGKYIMSWSQNNEIFRRYDDLRYGKFAKEHQEELDAQMNLAKEIVGQIRLAVKKAEMYPLAKRIHKELKGKVKEDTLDIYRAAFQEVA